MEQPTRVLFLGSKRLGLNVLKAMRLAVPDSVVGAVTIDDRTDVRNSFDEFERYARESGLRLDIARDKKHAEALVVENKPDLCLVVGWYWLIAPATLRSVPRGFVGIHNSLLPKYRGGSPLVWAIINGEAEVGFSLFSFTEGMDDGPVWAQASVAVGENDTIGDVLERFDEQAATVIRNVYPRILAKSLEPQAQDHSHATYCAQRQPDDGMIDWTWPAQRVHNFVRAQADPYPGAFTILDGQPIKVWRTRLDTVVFHGTPGQIATLGDANVRVVCGDHRCVFVDEVELAQGRQKSSEIIRSIKTRLRNR